MSPCQKTTSPNGLLNVIGQKYLEFVFLLCFYYWSLLLFTNWFLFCFWKQSQIPGCLVIFDCGKRYI